MLDVGFQLAETKRLAVPRVNDSGLEFDHLSPGVQIIIFVFRPDSDFAQTGQLIHRGIATKQRAILQQKRTRKQKYKQSEEAGVYLESFPHVKRLEIPAS